jgi:hypothetical protein
MSAGWRPSRALENCAWSGMDAQGAAMPGVAVVAKNEATGNSAKR